MFSNKVIIVTGGTKGIGKSIVLEFLKRGAEVITVYSRDDSAAEMMKKGLPADQQDKLFFHKGSVNVTNFLRKFFYEIESKFDKLNILINNAGINRDDLFLNMEDSVWDKVVTTNIKSALNTSLLASNLMKKSMEPAYIINVSSISGVFGRAGQANYACSKGAIIGVMRLLAKKFTQDRIFVNTVVPGLVNTEMIMDMPREKIEEIIRATVLNRIGETEEVAKVVLSLTSGDFSYVSGTCIKVDGGYLK